MTVTKLIQSETITKLIQSEIDKAKEDKWLETLKPLLEKDRIQDWAGYIIDRRNMRPQPIEQIAERAGLELKDVASYIEKGKKPRKRDDFIRLALALGLSLDETNEILNVYGGFPSLYIRDYHDAICIYVLSRLQTSNLQEEIQMHPYKEVKRLEEKVEVKMKTGTSRNCGLTGDIQKKVSQIHSDDDFLEYLFAHISVTEQNPHWRFARDLNQHLYSPSVDIIPRNNRQIPDNVKEIVKMGILPDKYRRILSLFNQHGQIPSRKKIISLGIRYNLTVEMLNVLLEDAHMSQLSTRNPEERILIFSINYAHYINPIMTYNLYESLYLLSDDIQKQNQMQSKIERMEDDNQALDEETLRKKLLQKSTKHRTVQQYVAMICEKIGRTDLLEEYDLMVN